MMPCYRYTDSYPHHKNQMPAYYPNLEGIPPQMMTMDPSNFPVSGGSWPCGGNYGYPVPCHTCCNHGYYPGFYNCRPPYTHFSSPFPSHCHGGYPPFPEAYPVQYVPPPPYSIEKPPRYEYDKDVLIGGGESDADKGSSNSFAPMELKNYPYPVVWIPPENQKNKDQKKHLDSELKDRDEVSHVTKTAENSKPLGFPNMWNGWFPVDMNSLGTFGQGEDGKRTQNWQDSGKAGEFPFPIFWVPTYDKPEEVEEKCHGESNAALKSAEETPSNFKVLPLKLSDIDEIDESKKKPRPIEDNSSNEVGSNMMEKRPNIRSIPVKQVGEQEELKTSKQVEQEQPKIPSVEVEEQEQPKILSVESEGKMLKTPSVESEGKMRGIASKHAEDNGTKRLSESIAKRKSPSSPKTSKLPPVCLRVDPFPRKKNCSRSPSPPGHKGSLRVSSPTGLNDNSQKSQKDSSALNCTEINKEVEANKETKVNETEINSKEIEANKETKVIAVARSTDGQNDDKAPAGVPIGSSEVVSRNPATTTEEIEAGAHGCKVDDGKGGKDVEEDMPQKDDKAQSNVVESASEEDNLSKATERKSDCVFKAEKRSFSDTDAAVVIQSAYRGFEVRKLEPLKKLRQIAKVREQVSEIQNHLHDLVSSPETSKDDRQILIIGETIMSLLLKLDMIQGLHPSLREIRKSVARDLTALQEKLDSLTIQKPKELIEPSTTKLGEDGCGDAHNNVSIQGGQDNKAKEVGSGENFSGSNLNDDNCSVLIEPNQGQPPCMADAQSVSTDGEASEPLVVDQMHGECEEETVQLSVASCVEPEAESEAITEPKDEAGNEVTSGAISDIQNENYEPNSNIELDRSMEVSLAMEDMVESELEFTGSGADKEGRAEVAEYGESTLNDKDPEEVSWENILEEDKHIGGGADKGEAEQTEAGVLKFESSVQLGTVSPDDDQFEQKRQESPEAGFVTAELRDNAEVLEDVEPRLEVMQLDRKDVEHANEVAQDSEAEEPRQGVEIEHKEVDKTLSVDPTDASATSQVIGKEEGEFMEGRAEPRDEPTLSNEFELRKGDASQISLADCDIVARSDKKLVEENEKLREMMERLIEAGKEQLTVISNLNGRVKDLEKKLSRKKKKLRAKRNRAVTSGSSYIKP